MPLLSVVVPVYNEEKTIQGILEKISLVPLDKEIVVVDDCSRDSTRQILQGMLKLSSSYTTKVIYHSRNKGKGEAVRSGIRHAAGQYVVIQDADLEYDPGEYEKLMKPLADGTADIVLGARFMAGHTGLFVHKMGNKVLTAFLNSMFGSRLNDYATCYKMARKQTFDGLDLQSPGFEIDVELICKALKRRLRIVEVPVSYTPRSYAEGKKIRWVDGLRALISMLKYRFA